MSEEKKDETQELLDSRRALYGDVTVNMNAVAKMVNGYLDGVELRTGKRELEGIDFAMIMVLYKTYRFAVSPTYGDNLDDVEGYTRMIRQIMGDDLIAAKTPDEYFRTLNLREAKVMGAKTPSLEPNILKCEFHAAGNPFDGPRVTIVKKEHCIECARNVKF